MGKEQDPSESTQHNHFIQRTTLLQGRGVPSAHIMKDINEFLNHLEIGDEIVGAVLVVTIHAGDDSHRPLREYHLNTTISISTLISDIT